MRSNQIIIQNKQGLHTRPSAQFVQEAKKFVSIIQVEKQDQSANGKSLIKLMVLGIAQGDGVFVEAKGKDAKAAVLHLANFLQHL